MGLFNKTERKKIAEIHGVTTKTDWESIFACAFWVVVVLAIIGVSVG